MPVALTLETSKTQVKKKHVNEEEVEGEKEKPRNSAELSQSLTLFFNYVVFITVFVVFFFYFTAKKI